jgi:hypothetical protein
LFNLALYAAFSALTITGFALLKRNGWRAHGRHLVPEKSTLARVVARLKRGGYLTRYPSLYIALFVPSYVAFAVLGLKEVPYDATVTIFILMCIAVISMVVLRDSPRVTLVERLIICTTITASVYYYITQLNTDIPLLSLENLCFLGLILALIMSYRFSQTREFRVTPMDFLVLFAVLVVPNILDQELVAGDIGEVAAKSVLLYYAAELLISRSRAPQWPIRAVLASVLMLFSVKALWL